MPDDGGSTAGHGHPRRQGTAWEPDYVVATYPYLNKRSELAYQTLRIEKPGKKKTFRQRQPDGNGGWIWNIKDVSPLPYMLPQLEDRPDEAPVWIVEGEKDVERLAGLGAIATTNSGGSSKWPEELNEYFLGANVLIIPDNDAPGRKHAAAVADALQRFARSVKIVELPGLEEGGDVSDWLDQGGTLERLIELADAAPPVEGPRGPFDPEDLGDLLAEEIEPRQWLLGKLLCRKYVTVSAASGGTGKTSLAITLALSLATGRPLLRIHVHKRCRVLLLTYEDGREEYKRRFKAACLHYNIHADDIEGRILIKSLAGAEGTKTLAEVSERGGMRETGTAERIAEIIRREEADVVMIDPFIKCSGAPENDNMAVDFVARILTRLAENENVAVHVSHHFRKGAGQPGDIDSARGARSLIDAARIATTMQPMTSEEAKTFDVSEGERRRLVRLDDGKANLAPLSAARWFRLASVNIGNATPEYPGGDDLQVVEAWTPPETWAALSINVLNRILDEIDRGLADGERYSHAPAATDRAAWKVIQRHAPEKTEKQCREVIATWAKNGVLEAQEYRSQAERKLVKGLKVNPLKRPGTIHG